MIDGSSNNNKTGSSQVERDRESHLKAAYSCYSSDHDGRQHEQGERDRERLIPRVKLIRWMAIH